ncbi:MAG TPA: hypothetical protein PK082_03005 [Phycisphaerae bacterium]|nr:hypothetical protein [Phycisphaerae bacterium]
MTLRPFAGILSVVFAASLTGCVQPTPNPPASQAEYEKMLRSNPQAYPRQTIVLFNLRRVMDGELAPTARLNSLQLADQLGGDDPQVRAQIASVLAQPQTSPEFREAVLTYLLKKDYPDLTAYVVAALPQLGAQTALREEVLRWLAAHPSPAVLSEVVRLWAEEESATGPNEPRYRAVVERVSGKDWKTALAEGVNSPEFTSRASAVEVLAKRIGQEELRALIEKTPPRTDAMGALQTFSALFDHVPTERSELLAAVQLYKNHSGRLAETSKLAARWKEDFGYRFNVRDFHLVNGLAGDPLRTILRRTQLVLEISHEINTRRHAHHKPSAYGAPDDYRDRFSDQVDKLSLADLWNLYLLNEMLTRPRIQLALRIMALRDRADAHSAWGGLVFYENGMAEAKLYPPEQEGGENDLTYTPCRRAVYDRRDSLCSFAGHFDKAENSARVGPDAAELLDARRNNYYGLVLTSLDDETFAAHYYNPSGQVVSLGIFPFRK